MAKATDTQIKNTKEALASGRKLPDGVRINFGDPEPIQKATVSDTAASASAETATPDKK